MRLSDGRLRRQHFLVRVPEHRWVLPAVAGQLDDYVHRTDDMELRPAKPGDRRLYIRHSGMPLLWHPLCYGVHR